MHQSVASTCVFAEICELLEALTSGKFKPTKRHELLAKFISCWRQKHKQLHGECKTDDSFFPAMRILLPSADKERGPYGFKEHMLAKKLIDVLVMDKKGSDAQLLLNYQSPKITGKRGATSSHKDFATIASDILKYRIDKKSSITLQDVDDRLQNIAKAHATGNKNCIEKELEFFCRNAGPTELKWIIRLLLKDMKIGIQDATVFKEYHPEALLLFDATTSLRQVCEKLRDPDLRLDVIQLNLFFPFRPMLANRCEPQNVAKIMNGQDFFVEIKYDGERCQLHKKGNMYKYFSRNGNDLTASFGENPNAGSITPFIHNAFSKSVKNCILDGEMVGWNPDAKIIATKVDHFDVKALNDNDLIRPCFVAFDCLLLNDKVFTQEPLHKRLEVLQELFDPINGRLLQCSRSQKSTTDDVIECLDQAIERREEGIVIKRKDSSYILNARSNEAGWLKIKPDYVDEICDDLDLVIIGGYFGEGRLSNLMSHFLLAVGDCSNNESSSEAPDKFVSICKVGSGYSAKELYDLNLYLNEKCILSRKKVPDRCQLGTEKPDVYIDPKNSKVLQIRAADIIDSNTFAAKCTIRFPRVEKIRDDKSWESVTMLDQLISLKKWFSFEHHILAKLGYVLYKWIYQTFNGKSSKQRSEETTIPGDQEISKPKKRRLERPSLGALFESSNLKNVETLHDVFNGREFCILNARDDESPYSKQNLEIKIKELGGSVVQYPGPKTMCAIAERKVLKMKSVALLETVDIVKVQWLINCINNEVFIPWTPSDMWFVTKHTQLAFSLNYDEFGDSYTRETNEHDLKVLFNDIDSKGIDKGELVETQFEYLSDYKYGLFKRLNAYIDCTVSESEKQLDHLFRMKFTENLMQLYGATIHTSVDIFCSHVVFDSMNQDRLYHFMEINRNHERKLRIVNDIWVNKCVEHGHILPEVL